MCQNIQTYTDMDTHTCVYETWTWGIVNGNFLVQQIISMALKNDTHRIREKESAQWPIAMVKEGVMKHKIIVEWVLAKMNDCVNAD